MMLGLILLAADKINSLMVGSSILLVAMVSSSPLRLPFSLYFIHWSHTFIRTFLALCVMLTPSTMSAASPGLPAEAPVFRGRRILLFFSVGAFTGPENSAAADFSCTLPHPTVVVRIFRFTICYCCTRSVLATNATMVAMLGRAGGCEYVRVGEVARTGCDVTGVQRDCSGVLPAATCLRVGLSVAAAATSVFDINDRRVAVAGGDHNNIALTATVLRTSLVRSAT